MVQDVEKRRVQPWQLSGNAQAYGRRQASDSCINPINLSASQEVEADADATANGTGG
jgi:hypothetical protein